MNKSKFRVVAGATAAALFLGLWALYTAGLEQANRRLALQLEAHHQRNFSSLVEHVQNLEMLLNKGLATGSPLLNLHYMGEVRRHTEAAISNFTGLPLPAPVSASTGKFLAQLGDFAYRLGRKEARGQSMNTEERQHLVRLRDLARQARVSLQETGDGMLADGYRWQQPDGFGMAGLAGMGGLAALWGGSGEKQAERNRAPGGLQELAGQMERLPAFVYDGPFSDHVARRQPALGGEALTQEQARSRLNRLVPNLQQWRVIGQGQGNGNLPTWIFTLAPAEGAAQAGAPGRAGQAGNTAPGQAGQAGQAPAAAPATPTLTVEVARRGGHLVQLVNSRQPGEKRLSLEQARDRGKAFLRAAGYADMEPVYGEVADGFATIQYVWRSQTMLVYPDQVRVKVALDNGEVVGVDAAQYVMNHRDRPTPDPKVSPEEAQLALNGQLDVEAVNLALIPDVAGTGEILTYEFRTRMGEDTFLVYINAETGQEERIMQVIRTETGTFAL